jgi:hypothetical protein
VFRRYVYNVHICFYSELITSLFIGIDTYVLRFAFVGKVLSALFALDIFVPTVLIMFF